jgi:hypothetical protein
VEVLLKTKSISKLVKKVIYFKEFILSNPSIHRDYFSGNQATKYENPFQSMDHFCTVNDRFCWATVFLVARSEAKKV